MRAFLPFSGFSGTVHEYNIDATAERDAESPESFDGRFDGMDTDAIASALYDAASYDWERMAREYVRRFPVACRFVKLHMPREYNFTNDRIEVEVSRATVRNLRREVDTDRMDDKAADRHTSRSGFASFYSPDWRTWGHVDTWDANQVETLLIAWCDDDVEDDIAESMASNGGYEIDYNFGDNA